MSSDRVSVDNQDVRVSVIIPVYNDPQGIFDTLESLSKQTYPTNHYEVIVVDNGSTDNTEAVIRRLADKTEMILRLYYEHTIQGSYAARNKGIRNAEGELLFFLDADVTVDRSWIVDCVDAMNRTGAQYAGCTVELNEQSGTRTTAAGLYTRTSTFDIEQHLREQHYADTAALLVRRSVIEEVGEFADQLISGGDREFGRRVHRNDIEQHYFSDITVQHPTRATATEVLKRKYRIGYGNAQNERQHVYEFDRPLSDPVLYLPNVWPWNARQWAEREFGGSSTYLSAIMILKLFVLVYVAELAYISGRIHERMRA